MRESCGWETTRRRTVSLPLPLFWGYSATWPKITLSLSQWDHLWSGMWLSWAAYVCILNPKQYKRSPMNHSFSDDELQPTKPRRRLAFLALRKDIRQHSADLSLPHVIFQPKPGSMMQLVELPYAVSVRLEFGRQRMRGEFGSLLLEDVSLSSYHLTLHTYHTIIPSSSSSSSWTLRLDQPRVR